MSFCVPACHTSPPLRPTAPPKRSSPRGRKASASARHAVRIMQQAVRHKASSRTPPSPLFPTRLEHPESGMQNVVLWHVVLRACCVHTSPPQRPTAPPKRSSPRGREASASARHAGDPSCSRPSDTRLPHAHLHHPSSLPASSIQVWHAKCSAMACRFACLLFHTSPPLRPTAPPKRSSPRGREASASARHAATHHAAGRQTQGFLTQTSITPLPYQPRASRVWHAKCSAMACRFACLLFHTSPPLRPTAPPKRSSPRGREASASARHAATHHAAGRQTQGFLTHTSITPLPYQARASRVWHAKCSAIACRFACLLFHTSPPQSPLLHPSAPRPGVERLLRQRVMRRPIMQRPSDTRLPHTHLHHPSSLPGSSIQTSGMQNVVLWHVDFACLLFSQVTTAKTHCSTQALLPRGRKASASARHAATHHADGLQAQGFLTHTSITPLPYQAPASKVWHAKCSAIA